MKKWGKRLLWAGVSTVVLFALLFIFLVTLPNQKIIQSLNFALGESLNSDVVIGEAKIQLFPRPHYSLQEVKLNPRSPFLITGPITIEEISGSFAWWPVISKKNIETTPHLIGLRLQLDASGASPIPPLLKAPIKKTPPYRARFPLLEVSQGEITIITAQEQFQLHKVRARLNNFHQLTTTGAQLQLASYWQDSSEQFDVSGIFLLEKAAQLHLHQVQINKGNLRLLLQGAMSFPQFNPSELTVTGSNLPAQSLLKWLLPSSSLLMDGTFDLDAKLQPTSAGTLVSANLEASKSSFSFPPWLQQGNNYPCKVQLQAEKQSGQTLISELRVTSNGVSVNFSGTFPQSTPSTWKADLNIYDLSSAKTQMPFLLGFASGENLLLNLEQTAQSDSVNLAKQTFRLSARMLEILNNQFSEVELSGVSNAEQLAFTGLKANWLGGNLSGAGDYHFATNPSLNLNLTGKNLSLLQWPQLNKLIDAQAELVMQVKTSGGNLNEALKQATWEGTLVAPEARLPLIKLDKIFSSEIVQGLNSTRSSPLSEAQLTELSQIELPKKNLRCDFVSTPDKTEVGVFQLEDAEQSLSASFSISPEHLLTGSAKLGVNPNLSQSFFEKPEWYQQSVGKSGQLTLPFVISGTEENVVIQLQKEEFLALFSAQKLSLPSNLEENPAIPPNSSPTAGQTLKAPAQPANPTSNAPKTPATAKKPKVAPTQKTPEKSKSSEPVNADDLDDLLKVIIH